jgi:hypothetical protein
MRVRNVAAVLVILLAIASTLSPIAFALPPLENGITFPAGTFVIPMDGHQAERILVFGFVHALLADPNRIQLFRVIEPPNVTLTTNMTASPAVFAGGPFLVNPSDAAKVAQVKSKADFKHVTVGVLTTQHVLDNIFRVTVPTKILVVRGEPAWGRTDTTLDAMKIPYNITTHSQLAANPDMMFSYTLIVIDCNGWNGNIPSQIAGDLRAQANSGHEVIFTDRALMDLNSTFPGYVTLTGLQPSDRVSVAYAYNPPRKYDLTKYGASADRFTSEFPSQYYNAPPRPNEINVRTDSMGIAVSSIPSGRVNDVRILSDSRKFGPAGNQYAILAFYFEYGQGIVEGLAFHPQEQSISTVGANGYYAVYEFYGNKFVHGPPPEGYTLDATPKSATTAQGTSVAYTITVQSYGSFNKPVSLSITSGMPPFATYNFVPPAPQPPAGGAVTSTLTVAVPLTTPVGTYVLNVTGHDTSSPAIVKSVLVTLNVTLAPADFKVEVSPNSLTINATESKNAIVTVTSEGTFNQNVTLSVTGLPAHVTVTFTPPAPQPPAGGTADSIMRITVGGDAVNATYPLTIVGSNGTATRSAPFTLTIVKPAPHGIPWLTLLLIILMALLGVVFGLVAYALSSRGRPSGPSGMKYVVPVNAQRMRCPNCGNPIALDTVYCPFCGRRRGSPVASGVAGYGPTPRRGFAGRRAVWGFVCAMIGGILILANSVELLSAGFWGPPTGWSDVFWWLGGSSGLGQSLAVLIGLIAGLTVIAGGMMMVMRHGPIGAVITFPFAVLSFIIGGGFIAGGILGIVAGILGMIRR